ncbi:hypothetical protein [Bordetella petrii]|uniref:hypothetical protein n=1 Tax=Bordetella petrii TaxID=94624 RepID=UPI00048E52E2|nr:hypothetical protein [Bordetella petrii]
MDDVLNDALSNLEHDNYERSHKGYENRQADIALIRAALAAQPAASAEPEKEDDSIALDKLADYIADTWPTDKKYSLEEICQRLHAMWPGEFLSAADLEKNEPNIREALRALLLWWGRFQASDGNQQDAYNLLAKSARPAWQFASVEFERAIPVPALAAQPASSAEPRTDAERAAAMPAVADDLPALLRDGPYLRDGAHTRKIMEQAASEIERLRAAPAAAIPAQVSRAISRARTAMSMWENGHAFDTHGVGRDIQREIDAADALCMQARAAAGDAKDADPMQGAADWLVAALAKPRPTEIAARLLIGYNRAERLYDAALAQQRKGQGGE